MSKVYVLQKDLPDLKAGSIGVVNDKGLLCFYEAETPEYFFPKETYESNIEWFLPKEEKIEVSLYDSPTFAKQLSSGTERRYSIYTSQPIPQQKYEAVKKAIEDCLNDKNEAWISKEVSNYANSTGNESPLKTRTRLAFTEQQYLEIWEMIFSITGYPETHPKYKKQ